jgi:G3E family GTPase
MLLHARGEDVLRVKGLVDVGEMGPVLLNGVQHVVHPPGHLEEWPDEDRRSRIVFIMRGVRFEELLASLKAFQDPWGGTASARSKRARVEPETG